MTLLSRASLVLVCTGCITSSASCTNAHDDGARSLTAGSGPSVIAPGASIKVQSTRTFQSSDLVGKCPFPRPAAESLASALFFS